MVGITSYGAYIPFYRLPREVIGTAWGKRGGKGERAVAGGDEDTITLGVGASYDCLTGTDAESLDALYFATTTPPYALKQSASIIAAAINMRKNVLTMDFGHSLRSGTSALKAALDAIKGNSSRNILVAVSDTPLPPPDSPKEMEFGDGAAAFIIGNTHVVAGVEGSFHLTSEFMDPWRLPGDLFEQQWEDRFVRDKGYMRLLPEVVAGLLQEYDLKPGDFDKVVYNTLDARSHMGVAKKMGFDYKNQVQDPLIGSVGNAGAASAPMMLVSALEQARPGDRIMFVNYGDGADAFILKVTDHIEKMIGRRGIKTHLDSKRVLPSYGKYLHFREMMEWEQDRRPAARTSLTHYYRESDQLYGLIGQKCNTCDKEQFPRQRICMWCQARMEKPTEYENVPLARQKGKLFTFSLDERAPVPDPPNVLCVVDLEGGARYYGLMTDREPEDLAIGQEMEFTFRKIHDAQGVHNYFWKVRPVRA
jgi:3-hydroxy-3-methylglutaryl CoA synthase